MKSDPPVRRDGRCAQCGKPRKPITGKSKICEFPSSYQAAA